MGRRRSPRTVALEDAILTDLANHPHSDRYEIANRVLGKPYEQRIYTALRGLERDGRVTVDRSMERRRHFYSRTKVRAFDSIEEAWSEAPGAGGTGAGT